MEQGFSPSHVTSNDAARTATQAIERARTAHPTHKPKVDETALSASEAAAKGTALHGTVAKGERNAEESLRGVQSKLMLPGLFQLGAFVFMPLGWATQKLPRVKAALGSVLVASNKMLDTPVTQWAQMPANYMSAVAEQASEAGVQKWTASATAKSTTWKATGEAVQKSVAEYAKPFTSAITGAFEKFSQTGFAKAIPSVVKNTLGKVRGASVFQVLMTAGVTAGMAATMVGSRAEKKETKAAFDHLMADIGGDTNSPFAKAVKQTYVTKKKTGLAKTGLELASGVVEGVMWAMPGVGIVKIMTAQMVPELCKKLVPECPTLGAHAALAKADAGELKMDAAARTDLWKQLIAIMPSVAANGGEYNRLTTPIAKEFEARGLTAKQGVQLLKDENAFTALAGEIFAKQAAAAKAKEHTVAAQPVATSKAEGAYHAAEKPSMAVVGHKALEGAVAHTGLHRAPSF
jgi:hypothetical protein